MTKTTRISAQGIGAGFLLNEPGGVGEMIEDSATLSEPDVGRKAVNVANELKVITTNKKSKVPGGRRSSSRRRSWSTQHIMRIINELRKTAERVISQRD